MNQNRRTTRQTKAEWVYTALLHLSPRAHCQEYGLLMLQAFKDHYHDTHTTQGRIGIGFWLEVLSDLTKRALSERWSTFQGGLLMQWIWKHPGVSLVCCWDGWRSCIQGGTFTISNLGMYGIDTFTAIVNAPQAAILAVSRMADRVVAVGGQAVVQPMIVFSLSCDHRVIDGARGAQFLATLAELIEEPLGLLG